jgi:hypothetical protein
MEPPSRNARARQRRSDYADLGCILPEESTNCEYFNPKLNSNGGGGGADDDTVVRGNLDNRPKYIGKLEKLHSLSTITQEDKDARDRQLIEMYTRPRPPDKRNKNKAKSKSSPSRMGMGAVYKPPPPPPPQVTPQQQQQRPNCSRVRRDDRPKWNSNRSIMTTSSSRNVSPQVPEQFYPYYDLVVTDSPTTRVVESKKGGVASAVARPLASAASQHHEVILPPFSPGKLKDNLVKERIRKYSSQLP